MEWSSPPPPPPAGRPHEFSHRLREFRRKNSAHSPSPPPSPAPSAALMAAWSALGASLREDELARGGRVAFCLGEPPMMNVLPKTTVR